MQFSVTNEYLEKLRAAIEHNEVKYLTKLIKSLHPADLAEVLNHLELPEAKRLYNFLDEETASEVLVELDEDVREKILESLSSKEIAENIDNLSTDEAADVIAELPDEKQDEVLSMLEDEEQASDIADLMKYEEGTAGAIMDTEFVAVNVHGNMFECVRQFRKHAGDLEQVYGVYVVDDDFKLLGTISIKKILTGSLRAKIENVYDKTIASVKTGMDAEEAAKLMEKYDLTYVPVVDHLGRLVGRITIDDALDVIREEETEDVQKMAAVEALEEPYMSTPFLEMIKKRAGWLIVLFIGESFTATAMGFFQSKIEKAVVLALFVPLIISSGGNTGSQASSLIIRALALGEITVREWWNIVRKEIRHGLALGVILGIIGFLRVAIWSAFVNVYGEHWLLVGLAVGISLIGVVLWGNMVGSIFPIFLKKVGLDPAVSSAPFVATFVDVTGLVIYFTVATLFLRGILL